MNRSAALVLAVALATLSLRVSAEEPRPLAQSLAGEAKTQYDVAKILYRDGDYAGALARFRRAYDVAHDPRLLWNMAACEKNLRHYVKVLRLVDTYLKDGGALVTAEDRAEARTFEAAVRALVGELRVDVAEPGATVSIDDVVVGTTPVAAPVLADQGARKIRVVKSGFRPAERSVDVAGGETEEVTFALERETGRLDVRARASDTILIDGRAVGRGAWSGPLPVGPHEVAVSSASGRTRKTQIVLADRETRDVVLESDAEGLPKWVYVVGGGVLLAGGAIGGYFLLRPSPAEPPTGTIGAYRLP